MAKGYWVRVYESKSEDEAKRKFLEKKSLGYKVKITRRRLGRGWWRTVWVWHK